MVRQTMARQDSCQHSFDHAVSPVQCRIQGSQALPHLADMLLLLVPLLLDLGGCSAGIGIDQQRLEAAAQPPDR